MKLLRDRFSEWQSKGFFPPERLNPATRQTSPFAREDDALASLIHTTSTSCSRLFAQTILDLITDQRQRVVCLLGIGKIADWDSKLCRWDGSVANEKVAQTFSNQALNTMVTYAGKAVDSFQNAWFFNIAESKFLFNGNASTIDSRNLSQPNDFWITDPPYADAINYHELSEFFLAWYERIIPSLFPSWYTDTKGR